MKEKKQEPWKWQLVQEKGAVDCYTLIGPDVLCRYWGVGALPKDASLIEAAPKLLEALRWMVEQFQNTPQEASMGFDSPPEPASQWDYDAFQALFAARAAIAIAKATESPAS